MEQEILNIAIENLAVATGLQIKVTRWEVSDKGAFRGDLAFAHQGFSLVLPFVVQRKVTTAQLPDLRDLAANGILLVLESAPAAMKEQLRELGIHYLEMSGNAFISGAGLYLFVDTHKKMKLEESSSSSAFSSAGLKVIYQLLKNSDAIHYTYRALGEMAGVSIDTVGRVYRELVRDKYLVKIDSRSYKILDYDRLFQDWVTLFNKILRPKLKKRSFRLVDDASVRSLLAVDFDGKIGGELAAEQLSTYNIAEKATIYVKGSFVNLAKELGLRPDTDGSITLIEQFWNDAEEDSARLVALPLVYADLIADPKPRNLLLAKSIYHEHAYQTL